jgi:hypothetical protein
LHGSEAAKSGLGSTAEKYLITMNLERWRYLAIEIYLQYNNIKEPSDATTSSRSKMPVFVLVIIFVVGVAPAWTREVRNL